MTVRFNLISVIIFIVDLKIFSSVLFPRQLLIQHFAISRSLILRIHAILQANQIRNWNQFCPRSIAFFRARRSLCVCVWGGGLQHSSSIEKRCNSYTKKLEIVIMTSNDWWRREDRKIEVINISCLEASLLVKYWIHIEHLKWGNCASKRMYFSNSSVL